MKLVEGAFLSNFYPRPPRGGRPAHHNHAGLQRENFYPRPPRGGRHVDDEPSAAPVAISIHALREEGDGRSLSSGLRHGISIHALREEGDCSVDDTFDRSIFISIHALREEGDAGHCGRCGGAAVISIHALREEGDRGCRVFAARHMPFLSTPSVRRATLARLPDRIPGRFLSTPSVRRATFHTGICNIPLCISIHASVRRATHFSQRTYRKPVFLSTPSVRRATVMDIAKLAVLRISIHALREEGDNHTRRIQPHRKHFYPRPP